MKIDLVIDLSKILPIQFACAVKLLLSATVFDLLEKKNCMTELNQEKDGFKPVG
jgi:hypothetical protein